MADGQSLTGARNGRARITEAQAAAIKGSDKASSVLAAEYGIAVSHVARIRAGTSWIASKPSTAAVRKIDPNNPAAQGEWRPIQGYEGLYDVSSDGRVRSWSTRLEADTGGLWPALIVLGKNRSGYPTVSLWKAQVAKTRMVHQLVAAAFIGPRPRGLITLHGDGTRDNNHFTNLRYGTHYDNYMDSVKHGTARMKPHVR